MQQAAEAEPSRVVQAVQGEAELVVMGLAAQDLQAQQIQVLVEERLERLEDLLVVLVDQVL